MRREESERMISRKNEIDRKEERKKEKGRNQFHGWGLPSPPTAAMYLWILHSMLKSNEL